jgi:HAD superfamily hydrolase (TIGR01490 family)
MTEKRVAAFFDFDNTLLADDSVRLGVRYLYDNRMISRTFILGLLFRNFFYKRNLYSQQRMIAFALKYYRDRDLTPLVAGSEKFFNEMLKPRLSRRVLERLEWHRERGHVPVIISASLRYLLEPAAKGLSIPHLLCTDLEMGKEGRSTGRAAGMICAGVNKAKVAREFAAANSVDLASSYAYSDHHSDAPLLELVGNPVVVGPNEPMRRIARERGWPVISHGNATEESP